MYFLGFSQVLTTVMVRPVIFWSFVMPVQVHKKFAKFKELVKPISGAR